MEGDSGDEVRLAPQSTRLAQGCSGASPPKVGTKLSTEELQQIFEKKFQFKMSNAWQLPPPGELFAEYYNFPELQKLRSTLNAVKSKLNNYPLEEWSAHTRRKDPAAEVPWSLKNETNAEFVTVAWSKFFECLNKYDLVKGPQLNTLHLCEAPGAFIAALNHYLHTRFDKEELKWQWLATTLNPYYEGNPLTRMIIDDRFMLYTLDHWVFYDDFTGNIISSANIEQLAAQCTARLEGGVHLVTADGSIDCVEKPDRQEELVESLHFAEITAALSVLADGGTFVLKMFTLFEASSVCKMFLLNCVFVEVNVFKPATSKRGNSEIYVVCLGFKKHTQHLAEYLQIMKSKLDDGAQLMPLFTKAHPPPDYLLQHEICARMFMNLQITAIESNIRSFGFRHPHETSRSHRLRSQVTAEYYRRYKVQELPEASTILHQRKAEMEMSLKTAIHTGSYTERALAKKQHFKEKVQLLSTQFKELEYSLKLEGGQLLTENNAPCSLDVPIQIYTGTPYETIESSLFAAVHVLVFRQKVKQTFDEDPLAIFLARCVISSDCTIEMSRRKGASEWHLQQKFFTDVLNGILTHRPTAITFEHGAFLTHFSVSLLRHLANIFGNLSIKTGSPSENKIQINCVHHDARTDAALKSLLAAIGGPNNVMCLMDIRQLHRNAFWKALTEYNNLLLLQNFRWKIGFGAVDFKMFR